MYRRSRNEYTPKTYEIEYDEIIGRTFKIVLEPDFYSYDEATSTWVDKHGDEEYEKQLVANGEEVKIVGIVRPANGSLMVVTTGAIGYTVGLTEHVITETNKCEIVRQQLANPETDVFTGLPFVKEEAATEAVSPETAPAASEVSLDPQLPSGEAPKVSSMAFKGETPVAKATALSEDEIFALIDETYSGQQREDMRRMVTLFLQSKRTDAEKAELVSLLPETMAIPGMGDMPASQAVDMIGSIPTKSMKLDILTGMINGDYGDILPPVEDGGSGTDTETPVEPEVPEEPEPQPFAASYDEAISLLGVADLNKPTSISIFPIDFESKDMISADIESYNQKMEAAGKPNSEIKYTDYIGLLLSSVTKIVNVISYVLIAFVAISLVVSSLMIGIITYISVLERTKEIGILRAIGASKKDISSVFNAETLIVGFVSGAIGIGTTLLLTIPINAVIEHLTKIADVAQLPTNGAIILVAISMVLTFVAGLIPSRIASKKDPVVALRSE